MYSEKDYDNTIETIQLAKQQLGPDGESCSICGDIGHQAFECHFNPLVAMSLRDKFRCYHCGEIFDAEGAKEHFGTSEQESPFCLTTLRTQLKTAEDEVERLKRKYWADMNTARCILLNRMEDLSDLEKDMRQKEFAAKKSMTEQALKEEPE